VLICIDRRIAFLSRASRDPRLSGKVDEDGGIGYLPLCDRFLAQDDPEALVRPVAFPTICVG
jgi:hypothetical protein